MPSGILNPKSQLFKADFEADPVDGAMAQPYEAEVYFVINRTQSTGAFGGP